MVDNMNPTNQFHPYTPETSTPAVDRPSGGFAGGLNDMLKRVGVDTNSIGGSLRNMNASGQINKARDYAAANPAKVLGGLAALAIGAGLMRRRTS